MTRALDGGGGGAVVSTTFGPTNESDVPHLVDRAPRAALAVFVVIAAGSFVLAIQWGRHRTFFLDEWDFLAARDARSFDSLMRPHNEHWTALPILAYRAVWSIFGMRSYLPYQLLSISTHLAAAALLRAVMRRSDVAPWIATAAAGLFALFGAGAQNILYGFQITFVGSLAFGFAQLLLADHDGPIERRDLLAIGAGLAGLMCSGVGVAMFFIVGLAVLVKRGWQRALLQTAPPFVAYFVWWRAYGQDALATYSSRPGDIFEFVVSGITGTFDALGQVRGVGLLLALVIILGLVVIGQSNTRNSLRGRLAAPLALALGSIIFLGITGYGRAFFGADAARASRYLDLVAAMWLPLIAVAATAVSRRWRAAGVVVLSLFIIGAIGNARVLSEDERHSAGGSGNVNLVMALAHADLVDDVPGDVRPFPEFAPEVSTGWLAAGASSGRLPEPDTVSKTAAEGFEFRLSFAQRTQEEPGESCVVITTPIDRELHPGESLVITGGKLHIADLGAKAARSRVIEFSPLFGNRIDVLSPQTVRLSGSTTVPRTRLCP